MRKSLFIVVLTAFSVLGLAQSKKVPSILQRNQEAFNAYFQPEYVDVFCDKDFYFSGERIWYSLYLSDEAYAPGSMSIITYVEIRDKNDSTIIRQKVRCHFGLGHGEMIVPEQLPTGYYKLTTYTLWMKNIIGGSQKLIPVINKNNPTSAKENPIASLIKVDRINTETLNVRAPGGTKGEWIVFSREEVLKQEQISDQPLTINLRSKNDRTICILLTDDSGKIIEQKQVTSPNLRADVILSVDRKEVSTRSDLDISIDLRDKALNPLNGNVTVSVRRKSNVKFAELIPEELDAGSISNFKYPPLEYRKEVFVYPPVSNSLQPINFSKTRAVVPIGFSTDSSRDVIQAAEMKNRISKAYGLNPFYETNNYYNLPANSSYEPSKYSDIHTVEEFIREIVPQIRIKKVKGEREFRLRNSENPALIYFFKGPPLILIDRFFATASEFLSIPLSDIERMDVLWGTREINSLGVISVTDNGVISITTNSRTRYTSSSQEPFKSLHNPLIFSAPKFTSKDSSVPFLFDPLYWNPSLRIMGRTKVKLVTSDELGDFIIEINGLTDEGYSVHEIAEFKVSWVSD